VTPYFLTAARKHSRNHKKCSRFFLKEEEICYKIVYYILPLGTTKSSEIVLENLNLST